MSLLGRRAQRSGESLLTGYVEGRGSRSMPGKISVTPESALRHSAVWACIRVRADMMASFPIDAYRKVGKINVEVPKPPVLLAPGGEHWEYDEWMWASQSDLDKVGNAVGIITRKNALGLPDEIELVPIGSVTVKVPRGKTMKERVYRIDRTEYPADQIWHERQFPVAGLPVGLSPVAFAAWSIGEYLNIQQFVLEWFSGGGIPKARLKNTKKTVPGPESLAMKERFKASVQNGDLFVHGNDWEYAMIQAEGMNFEWLDAKRFGLTEVCRFFGVPADLIDAAISGGGTITYANITERNLQFLIHHLGPAVIRREHKWSRIVGTGRFVKMNTDALLRMDPKAVAEMFDMRIKSRTMTVTEAREKYDLPPLTQGQIEEFGKLFGDPNKQAPAKVDPTQKASDMDGRKGRSIEYWIDQVERELVKGAA